MKLNKELYTKSEFILSFIFFGYFLFITFKSENYIANYFIVVIGFITANIILVLVLIFITKSKEIKFDERDKIIESRSYRNAYISTIVLVNVIIIMSVFNDNIYKPFVIFNLLLASLFISHIVLNLSKIFYYKRGL